MSWLFVLCIYSLLIIIPNLADMHDHVFPLVIRIILKDSSCMISTRKQFLFPETFFFVIKPISSVSTPPLSNSTSTVILLTINDNPVFADSSSTTSVQTPTSSSSSPSITISMNPLHCQLLPFEGLPGYIDNLNTCKNFTAVSQEIGLLNQAHSQQSLQTQLLEQHDSGLILLALLTL